MRRLRHSDICKADTNRMTMRLKSNTGKKNDDVKVFIKKESNIKIEMKNSMSKMMTTKKDCRGKGSKLNGL